MKQILLSAALLLGVGLQAQVGINTDTPTKTLDVNGTSRVRNIPDCDNNAQEDEKCKFQLVTDEKGNIKKRAINLSGVTSINDVNLNSLNADNEGEWLLVVDNNGKLKKRPVLSDGRIGFVAEKQGRSEPRTIECTKNGKNGTAQVQSPNFIVKGIGANGDDATQDAKRNWNNKVEEWFTNNGERECQQSNSWVETPTPPRPSTPQAGDRMCKKDGTYVGTLTTDKIAWVTDVIQFRNLEVVYLCKRGACNEKNYADRGERLVSTRRNNFFALAKFVPRSPFPNSVAKDGYVTQSRSWAWGSFDAEKTVLKKCD